MKNKPCEKNRSCENIPVLIDVLFKKAKEDKNFTFSLYSEIKNQEIGKYKIFLNNIGNLLLNTLNNFRQLYLIN